MDFDTLKNKFIWKQIHGCPGRFVLKHANKNMRIEQLLTEKATFHSFKPDNTNDEVIIVKLIDGGIISYKKNDGTFIHTLNTNEGFSKKLKKLNIDPDSLI